MALANAIIKTYRLQKLNISQNSIREDTGKALEYAFLQITKDITVQFDNNKIPNEQRNRILAYFLNSKNNEGLWKIQE